MRHVTKVVSFFVCVLLFSACIPQRKIVLMQDKNKDEKVEFDAQDNITDRYYLQPNDYLYINVKSPDEKISMIFNPMQSSSYSSSINNTEVQRYYNYMIDDSMRIDFPFVGKIDLTGCNMKMAKDKIRSVLQNYVSEFSLTVRLATNSYSVLGEVNKQGVYTMSRDQVTILSAIANAGGFTSYARRGEVKIVRQEANGKSKVYTLDLTDDDIINSDLYYVYPNDVLYVRPMRIKMFGWGETFSLTLVSSLVTLYLLARQL